MAIETEENKNFTITSRKKRKKWEIISRCHDLTSKNDNVKGSTWQSPALLLCATTGLCLRPLSCRRTGHRPSVKQDAPKKQRNSLECPIMHWGQGPPWLFLSIYNSLTWAWLRFFSNHLSSSSFPWCCSSEGRGWLTDPGARPWIQRSGSRECWNGEEEVEVRFSLLTFSSLVATKIGRAEVRAWGEEELLEGWSQVRRMFWT